MVALTVEKLVAVEVKGSEQETKARETKGRPGVEWRDGRRDMERRSQRHMLR